MIGIILICTGMSATTCHVGDAYAVLVPPANYTTARDCQFGAMEYAASSHLVRPGDVVRVICQPDRK